MKKSFTYAILLSFAGTFGASAETIVFDPGDPGADTITDSGLSSFTDLDLNQDGYNDIQLGIGGFFGAGGFVNAISDTFRFSSGPPGVTPTDPPVALRAVQTDPRRDIIFDGPPSFEAPYQEVYISATNGIADLFEVGDVVGANTFGDDSGFEDLFGAASDNALPVEGNSGYLGFRLDIGTSRYEDGDGFLPTGFTSTPESFYAFLNIEHGSIIFGQAGFNNVAGTGALIPGGTTQPIPLPAGLPLLLAGLGAFAFVKRRKA